MKWLKSKWYYIVAGILSIIFFFYLNSKRKKRDTIIKEWIAETSEHTEEIRRLEKISKAQVIKAAKELSSIDKKFEDKKNTIDKEIRDGQTTVADAWNRYFRSKGGANLPTP